MIFGIGILPSIWVGTYTIPDPQNYDPNAAVYMKVIAAGSALLGILMAINTIKGFLDSKNAYKPRTKHYINRHSKSRRSSKTYH